MACGERPRDVRIQNANLIWRKRIESKATRTHWKLLGALPNIVGPILRPETKNGGYHSKRLNGFRKAASGGSLCRKNMEVPVYLLRPLLRWSRSFPKQMLLSVKFRKITMPTSKRFDW